MDLIAAYSLNMTLTTARNDARRASNRLAKAFIFLAGASLLAFLAL
jgi:hypothetical protein